MPSKLLVPARPCARPLPQLTAQAATGAFHHHHYHAPPPHPPKPGPPPRRPPTAVATTKYVTHKEPSLRHRLTPPPPAPSPTRTDLPPPPSSGLAEYGSSPNPYCSLLPRRLNVTAPKFSLQSAQQRAVIDNGKLGIEFHRSPAGSQISSQLCHENHYLLTLRTANRDRSRGRDHRRSRRSGRPDIRAAPRPSCSIRGLRSSQRRSPVVWRHVAPRTLGILCAGYSRPGTVRRTCITVRPTGGAICCISIPSTARGLGPDARRGSGCGYQPACA